MNESAQNKTQSEHPIILLQLVIINAICHPQFNSNNCRSYRNEENL